VCVSEGSSGVREGAAAQRSYQHHRGRDGGSEGRLGCWSNQRGLASWCGTLQQRPDAVKSARGGATAAGPAALARQAAARQTAGTIWRSCEQDADFTQRLAGLNAPGFDIPKYARNT
jgi:hypothetical protein